MQRIALVCFLLLGACEDGAVAGVGPSITISPERATVVVGDSVRFTATVDGPDTRTVWTSSNETIVAVDFRGVARGRSPGVAIVTVSGHQDQAKQSVIVTVLAAP
jgi:uncharacterized protein YjdB